MTAKPGSPKPWHNDCTRLRAEGMDPIGIARRLGKSIGMVRWVLDENNERQAARERASQSRGYRNRPHAGVYHDPSREPRNGLEPAKRAVKAPISKEVKDAACLAFALFEIDRATLMARITP